MRRLLASCIGAVLLAGCNSAPTTLVESDVPIPPEMQVVFSSDLKRSNSTLSGGWFVFWGDVTDAGKEADATTKRFSEHGWRETSREMLPKRASLTYTKDVRTVRVDIDARRIDPRSSSATLRLSSTAASSGE